MRSTPLVVAAGLLSLVASHARAQAPDRLLYVASYWTSKVEVFEYGGVARSHLKSVDVCAYPTTVAVAADGYEAFVGCDDGEVWAMDALSFEARRLAFGSLAPTDIVTHPDSSSRTVYVANLDPQTVTELDPVGGATDIPMGVGSSARYLAISPGGDTLYVLSSDGYLSRVDTATRAVSSVLPAFLVDGEPVAVSGLRLTEDGNTVLVTSAVADRLFWVSFPETCGPCAVADAFVPGGPADFVVDPLPLSSGGQGTWIGLVYSDVVANLPFGGGTPLSVPDPAGMAYDDASYTFLAASAAGDFVAVWHFAAGPLPPIALPAGSSPRDVAVGPRPRVLSATFDPWVLRGFPAKWTSARAELHNGGEGPVWIDSLELDGEDAKQFGLETGCRDAKLAPGEACKVELRCLPAADGQPWRAHLVVRSSGAEGEELAVRIVCAAADDGEAEAE